ncbi:hypothetical protein ES706_00177 [subsurface metagenome]
MNKPTVIPLQSGLNITFTHLSLPKSGLNAEERNLMEVPNVRFVGPARFVTRPPTRRNPEYFRGLSPKPAKIHSGKAYW